MAAGSTLREAHCGKHIALHVPLQNILLHYPVCDFADITLLEYSSEMRSMVRVRSCAILRFAKRMPLRSDDFRSVWRPNAFSKYMFVYICICSCIRIYIYAYIHIHICVHTLQTGLFAFCTPPVGHTCTNGHTIICVLLHCYTCMYIYIYIYTPT